MKSFLLLLMACLVVGCSSKLTSANYDKIQNGMTVAQVKEILGNPSEEQSGGIGAVDGTSLVYRSGKNEVTINCINGKVVMKNGHLTK